MSPAREIRGLYQKWLQFILKYSYLYMQISKRSLPGVDADCSQVSGSQALRCLVSLHYPHGQASTCDVQSRFLA